MAAGRRVVLSDGSCGMIVETHTGSPLCPMVGDDHGRIRDLSEPSSPTIWEVVEDSTDHLQ